MSQEGERLATLEGLVKHQTDMLERLANTQDELIVAVKDLAVLRRDMDYHRRDIDLAHDFIRDLRGQDKALEGRVDALEGKELLNKYARWMIGAAALALIKLAWDSSVILNQEMSTKKPPEVLAITRPKD